MMSHRSNNVSMQRVTQNIRYVPWTEATVSSCLPKPGQVEAAESYHSFCIFESTTLIRIVTCSLVPRPLLLPSPQEGGEEGPGVYSAHVSTCITHYSENKERYASQN